MNQAFSHSIGMGSMFSFCMITLINPEPLLGESANTAAGYIRCYNRRTYHVCVLRNVEPDVIDLIFITLPNVFSLQ